MTSAAALLLAALGALVPREPLSIFSPSRRDAGKGAAKYREKKYAGAVRDFDAARRRDPDDPAWAFDLGTALGADGRADDARAALDPAARSRDRRVAADALYQTGTLELGRGRNADAADALRRSLMLDPTRADAKRNFEIAIRRKEAEKPPPQSSQNEKNQKNEKDQRNEKNGRPNPSPGGPGPRPPEKGGNDSEFEKRAGMTRSEAEALLRSLDAEQRQRERSAPAISGRDW